MPQLSPLLAPPQPQAYPPTCVVHRHCCRPVPRKELRDEGVCHRVAGGLGSGKANACGDELHKRGKAAASLAGSDRQSARHAPANGGQSRTTAKTPSTAKCTPLGSAQRVAQRVAAGGRAQSPACPALAWPKDCDCEAAMVSRLHSATPPASRRGRLALSAMTPMGTSTRPYRICGARRGTGTGNHAGSDRQRWLGQPHASTLKKGQLSCSKGGMPPDGAPPTSRPRAGPQAARSTMPDRCPPSLHAPPHRRRADPRAPCIRW